MWSCFQLGPAGTFRTQRPVGLAQQDDDVFELDVGQVRLGKKPPDGAAQTLALRPGIDRTGLERAG